MSSRDGSHGDDGQREARFGGVMVAEHDHLCAFFRGREERDRLLLPFLADGLRAGEICLCVTTEGEGQQLAPRVLQPGYDAGLFETLEPTDTYLATGSFHARRMLDHLDDWALKASADDSHRLARIAGDMSWIGPLATPAFIAALLGYEAQVTRWMRSHPLVGVCMYDVERLNGDVIIAMIKGHPKVWLDGQIIDNPYYMRPEVADSAGAAPLRN